MLSAFFLFISAGFISMYILHEQLGGAKFIPIIWMIIALLSIFTSFLVLRYIGQFRFNRFQTKATEYDLSLDSKKAIKWFERLLLFASSFYFLPTTTEKLLKQIYQEYSKLYLGMHSISAAAQEVYEETILRNPQDKNLQKILLDIYNDKGALNKQEMKVCFLIFKYSLENRQALELLSNYYIQNNIFDFDSQEIFSKILKFNSPSKEKAVDFLIFKLIKLQRVDNFAAQVFLTAFLDYSNRSTAIAEAIVKLALDRKKKKSTDLISLKIFNAYEKISVKMRRRLEDQLLEIPPEIKPTFFPPKDSVKKWGYRIFYRTIDIIQGAKNLLKKIKPRLQTFTVIGKNVLKQHRFKIFLSLALISIFLIVLGVLRGEKKPQSTLDLLNIEPQYTSYDSKLSYSVQVAAFKNFSGAETFINKLAKKGEKAYYTKPSGGSSWFRVRIGEFKTQNEAKFFAEKLLKEKLIKGYFITNFEPGFIKKEMGKK